MKNTNKIYDSLYKPVLFAGCERLPFTVITLIGAILIVEFPNFIAMFLVLTFYLLSVAVVRKINQFDSQFFLCLYRYVLYFQEFYPSNAFYSSTQTINKRFLKY